MSYDPCLIRTRFAEVFLSTAILLIVGAPLYARDCSLSEEFQIKRAQNLAGFLQDPVGAALPGVELQLLSRKTVIKRLKTTNEGAYNFGLIPAGKYRIRVRYSGGAFCAPKMRCTEAAGCALESKVAIGSKGAVTVQ